MGCIWSCCVQTPNFHGNGMAPGPLVQVMASCGAVGDRDQEQPELLRPQGEQRDAGNGGLDGTGGAPGQRHQVSWPWALPAVSAAVTLGGQTSCLQQTQEPQMSPLPSQAPGAGGRHSVEQLSRELNPQLKPSCMVHGDQIMNRADLKNIL